MAIQSGRSKVEEILRLGHSLGLIVLKLETPEDVDVDLSWIGNGAPPEEPERGAVHAIANVRELSGRIHEASRLAKSCLDGDLKKQVREALILTNEAIGQVYTPAEFILLNGDDDAAICLCREALERAYDVAGVALGRLSAAVLVHGQDAYIALNGTDVSAEEIISTENLTEKEADLVTAIGEIGPKGKRTSDAILSHLGKKGLGAGDSHARSRLSDLVKRGILAKGKGGYRLPGWD